MKKDKMAERTREELLEERARLQCLIEALDEEIFALAPPIRDRPMSETETIMSETAQELSAALAKKKEFMPYLSKPNATNKK